MQQNDRLADGYTRRDSAVLGRVPRDLRPVSGTQQQERSISVLNQRLLSLLLLSLLLLCIRWLSDSGCCYEALHVQHAAAHSIHKPPLFSNMGTPRPVEKVLCTVHFLAPRDDSTRVCVCVLPLPAVGGLGNRVDHQHVSAAVPQREGTVLATKTADAHGKGRAESLGATAAADSDGELYSRLEGVHDGKAGQVRNLQRVGDRSLTHAQVLRRQHNLLEHTHTRIHHESARASSMQNDGVVMPTRLGGTVRV